MMSIPVQSPRDKWLGTALVVTAGKETTAVGGRGRMLLTFYSALRGPSAHDALEKLTQSEKRVQKVLGDNKDMLIARAQQKKPPERRAFQSGTWRGFPLPPPAPTRHTVSPIQ